MTMVKSHKKKYQNYFFRIITTSYVMTKCHQNVNLEEIDTELVHQEKTWILKTVRNV